MNEICEKLMEVKFKTYEDVVKNFSKFFRQEDFFDNLNNKADISMVKEYSDQMAKKTDMLQNTALI